MEKFIRACPFCGGWGKVHFFTRLGRPRGVVVKCQVCGSTGKTFYTNGNSCFDDLEAENCAVEAWNRRASDFEKCTPLREHYSDI